MKKFVLIAVVLCVSSLVDAQPLWVSGSQGFEESGTYNNTLGNLNVIAARAQAACWGREARHSHVAWVFGGIGPGNSTADIEGEKEPGVLNDLWTFNSASEIWTFESGSPVPLDPGQYTPPGKLHPGSRKGAAHWYGNGLLWVFGGFGVASVGPPPEPEPEEGTLNDLWAYNSTSKTWQWIGGSQAIDVPPQYTVDPLNPLNPVNPGSRECSYTWVVRDEISGGDILWLFGGMAGEELYQNDLWSLNLLTHAWSFHNISTAVPSARSCGASWVGPDGNLYLFGGQEIDPLFEQTTVLNDIWQLNTTSLQWRNVSLPSPTGVYDNTTNARPSPRFGAAFTSDSLGNLWLFGGNLALDPLTEIQDTINDLWTYNTTGHYWTWVLGSSLPNQQGVYNATTRLGTPAARASACLWIDDTDRLWLFGGVNSTEEELGHRNDLWKLYDIVIPKPPTTTTTTGGHNDTTTGPSLTTGAVSTGSHNETTLTTGPVVSITTGPHNTTFSLTTGSLNTSTTGGLTTGGHSITTGSHNTTGLTSGPPPATITTAAGTSGNSTNHHPVSPAVITGTIMGGSVAVGLGIAGVFLYKRRQRQRDADGDAELLPLNSKKTVN